MTHTDPQLLPIGEAARLLGVSVETVRRWEREAVITSVRTNGAHRRFDIAEVRRVLRERAA